MRQENAHRGRSQGNKPFRFLAQVWEPPRLAREEDSVSRKQRVRQLEAENDTCIHKRQELDITLGIPGKCSLSSDDSRNIKPEADDYFPLGNSDFDRLGTGEWHKAQVLLTNFCAPFLREIPCLRLRGRKMLEGPGGKLKPAPQPCLSL